MMIGKKRKRRRSVDDGQMRLKGRLLPLDEIEERKHDDICRENKVDIVLLLSLDLSWRAGDGEVAWQRAKRL